MDIRRFLDFLIVAAFFCGCSQEFPKEIWFDDRFSRDEEAVLLFDMGLWEEQTGRDLFIYRGRIKVKAFRREDLADRRHIVYKVDEWDVMSPDEARIYQRTDDLQLEGSGHPSGWATPADILIFSFRLRSNFNDYYLVGLHATFEHELGHFTGLGHIEYDPFAVMSPGNGPQKCLKESDLIAFCSVNGCADDFSPRDAELRCRREHGGDWFPGGIANRVFDINEFFDLW